MHVKSVRGFIVLHVLIPLEVPSQVKAYLEDGSKLRDPKSESEVGLSPTGGSLKNRSRYSFALHLPKEHRKQKQHRPRSVLGRVTLSLAE